MEHTFMTIHNLTTDANLLFASESIADILGYQPSEVQGKSCFDYFHPDEIPFARTIHKRGVLLDKAAVLHYARILSRDGRWIGCECCFTIVHDVLVACVSIYRRGAKSERRAIEAPQIRRLFSCSPRDPRYHMLKHISPKFRMAPMEREPRAALILNRFTRNLTVMFATNAITSIIGLRPYQIKNKSFYRCIQENCLPQALNCLEGAKANDSIAYLRFNFQDPRDDEELGTATDDELSFEVPELREFEADNERLCLPQARKEPAVDLPMDMDIDHDSSADAAARIKREENDKSIALSSVPFLSQDVQPLPELPQEGRPPQHGRLPSVELEAVVSCTSDGLVVILRKARPPIPPAHPPLVPFDYGDGLFAAPWAKQPIRPQFPIESIHAFRSPLLPQYMPLRENVKNAGGPPLDYLMRSIREVAVFAWPVVGINPAMAQYGHGLPSGDARPNDTTSAQQQQHHRRQNMDQENAEAASVSARRAEKGIAPACTSPSYDRHIYLHDGPSAAGSAGQSASSTTASTGRGSCSFPPPWGSRSSTGVGPSPPGSFDYSPNYRSHHNQCNSYNSHAVDSSPSSQYYEHVAGHHSPSSLQQGSRGVSAYGCQPTPDSLARGHTRGWN